jgi:transcriptional regulator with XRE-family HTH domain
MNYERLGILIRTARIAARMEQQDLARELGVGQQAVSGWERGASRPRIKFVPAIASALGIALDDLKVMGEYDPIVSVQVVPKLLVLPFEGLSDSAFETFCRDLLRGLNPGLEVTRNGASGYKQFGVDVFVNKPGNRIGVQCKRHEKFGPRNVEAAVGEVLPEAGINSGVIALSRPMATPGARLAIHKHPGWELWDGEDLSSKIFDLPKASQLSLVDRYFPGYRERFLGIREPSPWLEVTGFGTSLAGRTGLDHHFPLAGRTLELARLSELIDSGQPLVVVVGRDGIGKTRLLTELARTEPDRPVRFVARGPINPEAFDLLPDGDPIVILDDALEMNSDLAYVVQGIQANRPNATVVVSVGPRNESELLKQLSAPTTSADSIHVLVGDLSLSDAEILATHALESDDSSVSAEALAQAGYDCPLLIIVGAHLLREGKLAVHELGTSDALRAEILEQFVDITVRGDGSERRRSTLVALASMQPVRLEQTEFIDAMAALSGQPTHTVHTTLDELENLGVVLRRGSSVRIVPNLLGEAILERALLSRAGMDTHFAAQLAKYARGDALKNAIHNVSIIDWYNQRSRSHLAQALWQALVQSALSLPNSQRISLASGIESVAVLYPTSALDLAEQVLENPAADEVDELSGIWGDTRFITGEDCARSLTRLIHNACLDITVLDRGMRLLWTIGVSDTRAENQTPHHGLRLLKELGEYGPDKSLEASARYVETLKGWLIDAAFQDDRAMVLSLLEPILADEIEITRAKGLTVSYSRRSIDLDVTSPVRSAAIDLAEIGLSGSPVEAVSAVNLLEAGLRAGTANDPITDEFTRIIGLLGQLISSAETNPSLQLSAYRALGWYAQYGEGDRRDLAVRTRMSLAATDSFEVVRHIRGGWAVGEEDDDEKPADQARTQGGGGHSTQPLQHLADSLLDHYDDASLRDHLLELMRGEDAIQNTSQYPDALLLALFAKRPSFSAAVLTTEFVSDRGVQLLQTCALATLLATGNPHGRVWAKTVIDHGVDGAVMVANAVTMIRTDSLTPDQSGVISELAALNYPQVSSMLIRSARWFGSHERPLVRAMLLGAPSDMDSRVAEAVTSVLADGRILSWTDLAIAERELILRKLEQCPRMEPYSVGKLLNTQIEIDAFVALQFLIDRIDSTEQQGSSFQPLPYRWSTPLDFRRSASFPKVLDRLLNWLLEPGQRRRRIYGDRLFGDVVGQYDDEVLSRFTALIRANELDSAQLVETLLDAAPHDFVLEHSAFVTEALTDIETANPDVALRIRAGLHGSAIFGMHSRTVGAEHPTDLALIEGAAAIASRYPKDSPIGQFYQEVVLRAQSRIASDRADDLGLEETRRW